MPLTAEVLEVGYYRNDLSKQTGICTLIFKATIFEPSLSGDLSKPSN